MKIVNPYENIGSMVRHKAISHEHTYADGGSHLENKFQDCLNRGIDIFCGVSYQPSIPQYPVTGWEWSYIDWSFVLDINGNIEYELDGEGNKKYITTPSGDVLPVPQLIRVTKTNQGEHHNFVLDSGEISDIANLVQLPNSEHAFFEYTDGIVHPGIHLNFIGSTWGEPVNGILENLDKYNEENNLNLDYGSFRTDFPLWTIEQVFQNVRNNILYSNKVFGTINHPAYSYLTPANIINLLIMAPDLFKGIEIYNNGDRPGGETENKRIYDEILLRGFKIWCVAVNDWGKASYTEPTYPNNRGCNLMYLPTEYENATRTQKEEMALDAYIAGRFAASGYGTIDISSVNTTKDTIGIQFNDVMDRVVVDIDGNRQTINNISSASIKLKSSCTFARFEAYKDNDFLFTQPFFVTDKGLELDKISILFD